MRDQAVWFRWLGSPTPRSAPDGVDEQRVNLEEARTIARYFQRTVEQRRRPGSGLRRWLTRDDKS